MPAVEDSFQKLLSWRNSIWTLFAFDRVLLSPLPAPAAGRFQSYCFHIPPLKSALPHQVAPQVGFAISSHAMSFIKAWFHPVSKYSLSASSDLGCTYTFLKYSQLLLCWLMEGVSFEPLPLVQPRQQIQEFISLFYILLFLPYRAVVEQFSCDQDCTKELTYVVNHNDYNRNFKMIGVLTAWPLWMYLKRQCIREANCSELCS